MVSSLGDPAMRRSYSLPLRDNGEDEVKTNAFLRHSKSEDIPQQHKVDRYGFILNMDSHGNLNGGDADGDDNHGDTTRSPLHANETAILSPTLAATTQRRVKKWDVMLSNWSVFRKRKRRLVKKRLRKGIPDEQRGTVWPVLCGIDDKIAQHPGLYTQLVQQSVGNNSTTSSNDIAAAASNKIETHLAGSNGTSSSKSNEEANSTNNAHKPIAFDYSKSFKVIQDTIERDIHRTFPRHTMFYKSDDGDDEDSSRGPGNSMIDDDSAVFQTDICGSTEIRTMIREMKLSSDNSNNQEGGSTTVHQNQQQHYIIHTGNANGDTFNSARIFVGTGGQSRLRRVLKAYSTYDREIGYCQGMNFIAAMFLTLMSEEQAFWMLVSVMYDEPCHMRGLFGEGMRETHKVLFVAEKLIEQFLPKLAKHLDREMIHVTMYSTQWLLTQYTSSFKFDLVTRVWDCFLFEGWKITYRVMLSILQRSQVKLLSMSFEEILGFFRELPDRPETNATIVDEAIKIPLRTSQITRYEKQWREQQEDQERSSS